MIQRKSLPLIARAKHFLWWCSGVNISLLSEIKSEWQKFYAIGLTILLSSIIGCLSMVLAGSLIFSNIYLSVAFGILWGLMTLSINKSFVLTFRANTRKNKLGLFLFRTFFALTTTFTISYTLQILLFDKTINEKLSSTGKVMTDGLLAKLNAFQELKNENLSIAIFSWLITIIILLIELLPIILTWLSSNGIYETTLRLREDTELRNFELSAKEEYDKMHDRLAKGIQKREDLASMPFGGLEFYIDYKSLRLDEINSLFASLNNIYSSVYRIESLNNVENIISEQPYHYLDNLFKSHSEDKLLIHSIETGNSITFKISTGWKPKVELIKGDFIIYLPKGSIALLLTGFLITKIFDYGISNYKQLLEIEKLKKENKVLDNQLLKEQVNAFNSKLEASPNEIKEKFQLELLNFYEITLNNSNFIQTKITQDTLMVEKMNKGEVSVAKDPR